MNRDLISTRRALDGCEAKSVANEPAVGAALLTDEGFDWFVHILFFVNEIISGLLRDGATTTDTIRFIVMGSATTTERAEVIGIITEFCFALGHGYFPFSPHNTLPDFPALSCRRSRSALILRQNKQQCSESQQKSKKVVDRSCGMIYFARESEKWYI